MPRFATPLLLAALLLAAPAVAQTFHNTGTVRLQVFSNGMLGQSLGVGGGFTYNNVNGLFEGQLMFGTAADRVSGSAYASDPNTPPADWLSATSPVPVTAPSPFNEAYSASFIDFGAPNPFNISVTQKTYSSDTAPNNDFVVVEYDILNASGGPINGARVGFFADWDVNAATANLGGYDPALRFLWVYDTAAPTTHYGTMLLGDAPVSGWDLDTGEGVNPTDAAIWASMTTFDTVPTAPSDRRTLLAAGPYDIPANGTLTVRFALVAGTNLADITANAQAAAALFPVAADGRPTLDGVDLAPAAPNPTRGTTDLAVTLDAPQAVRLAVYDLLGREVAVLLDGDLPAGTQRATFDAAGLPAGLYVARLQTAAGTVAQRVTVAR
jgi:hypothetical protein